MWPFLALMCVIAIGVGLACSVPQSDGVHDSSTPNVYTIENTRHGDQYHVEQGGQTQDFEVIATHWSGYFQVRVVPPDEHQLDRDYPVIVGWTRELPSDQLIEAKHLQRELPIELRFAAN
ncbi:MAG: hypothetical protein ACEQSB_03975 [Undibacterium sp.]